MNSPAHFTCPAPEPMAQPHPTALRVLPKPARTLGTGRSAVVTQCQVCGDEGLQPVLFLGYLPPVNSMPAVGSAPKEQEAYPALLLHCPRCELVQLGLTVDPAILFPPEYPYTSGTTRILRENFAELYQECSRLLELQPNDLVVDIGSNDGTLLSNFASRHRVYGIEPSDKGELASAQGIPTLISFFNAESVRHVCEKAGLAKVITATNVFAHIEDIHAIVEQILSLLAPEGVFISESHYLPALIETLQYDTIYHEHLRYYSLQSLSYLLEMHGLEVFHAKRIPTHGGSIRVYAARKGTRARMASVDEILEVERRGNLTPGALAEFKQRVTRSKLELHALLGGLKRPGVRIYAVGAPSRASTLVNYVGLDDGIIDCVLEIGGSYKIGKYLPGTLIPVENEQRLFTDQPEYALLLSWHIADELIPKLVDRGYRGKFIVPLPEPRVIEAGGPLMAEPSDSGFVDPKLSPEPLVSLIVCVKDGMPFLPQALESVRAQTYRHFELVIQDGGSADGSLEYLRALEGFPRLSVVSEPDGGIGDGFNRAVRRCRGEIIGSIDADNLLAPDALARVVHYFKEHPAAAAVYGGARTIDGDGRPLNTWMPAEFDAGRVMRCEVVPPFGQSFFNRRQCGEELRFEAGMKTCADFDLWLRLSDRPIHRLEAVVGSVRLSEKSMTCRPETYRQACGDKEAALQRHLERCGQDRNAHVRQECLGGLYAWAAESLFNLQGDSELFRHYLNLSGERVPGSAVVARLNEQVEAGRAAAAPGAAGSSPEPIPASDRSDAAAVLARILQDPSPSRYIARHRDALPPSLQATVVERLSLAQQGRNAPLVEALTQVYHELALGAGSRAETSPAL